MLSGLSNPKTAQISRSYSSEPSHTHTHIGASQAWPVYGCA